MSDKLAHDAVPVSFGAKLAGSQSFAALFREGMALVEETAAYLDGPGRKESKGLQRNAALAYATESMRLTTRLMQLASWLLLHRAVNEGEMSLAQANKERMRVKLPAEDPNSPPDVEGKSIHPSRLAREGSVGRTPALPSGLDDLIARSKKLKDQVRRLDATIHAPPPTAPASGNPFEFQLGMLRAAFERRPPT